MDGQFERGDRDRRRAQMIIVASFALAVTFVTLALLLNTVIFATNLATRQTGGATDVGQLAAESETAASAGITHVNHHHNASATTLSDNFTKYLTNWSALAQRQQAVAGMVVTAEVQTTHQGTRLRQADRSRNFTAGDTNTGAGNWTLVTGTPDVRSFRLTVDRGALFTAARSDVVTVLDQAFHITITDGTDTWNLYVMQDSANSEVVVFSEAPGETISGTISDYCSVDSDWVAINLTEANGTVGGDACNEAAFPELSGSVDVEYHNADDLVTPRSGGTYELVVNTTSVESQNFNTAPTSPFEAPAIYSARIHIEIETPRANYTADRRAFPDAEGR